MTVEMTRWAMDFMFEIKKPKLGGVQWVAFGQQFQGTESAISTRERALCSSFSHIPIQCLLVGNATQWSRFSYACAVVSKLTAHENRLRSLSDRKFQASPQRFRLHGCDVGPRGLDFCNQSRSVPDQVAMGIPCACLCVKHSEMIRMKHLSSVPTEGC